MTGKYYSEKSRLIPADQLFPLLNRTENSSYLSFIKKISTDHVQKDHVPSAMANVERYGIKSRLL
jgi:hypothetical protein